MGALAIPRLTVEQYLALDRKAEIPSEFHDGEIFPMVATSWAHSRLVSRVDRLFQERLDGKPCEVGASSTRVRGGGSRYVYPDLTIVCGHPEFADDHADTLLNPKVIVEVLSPSTEDYDLGTKSKLYRELPSLEAYVLVSQTSRSVEVLHRMPDNRWVISTYDAPRENFVIEPIQIEIPLEDVYAGILD